jgi:hypothetical protein
MLEHDQAEEQVRQFVAKFLSADLGCLTPSTRLCHDLGVTGDDGEELMEAFSERFGVEMSGFVFDRHFGSEAECNPLMYALMWLFERERLRLVPITLTDLAEAAQTGVWQTPNRAAV